VIDPPPGEPDAGGPDPPPSATVSDEGVTAHREATAAARTAAGNASGRALVDPA